MFAATRRTAAIGLACAGLMLVGVAWPAAAQQIDKLNPSIAKPGQTITVEGQGFATLIKPSIVHWDGVAMKANTTVNSANEIEFKVPNGASCGPHDIEVENPSLTGPPLDSPSFSSTETLRVFCISSVNPTQGGAGTAVTVKGGGFTQDFTPLGGALTNPGSEVELAGQPIPTTYIDGQTLEFTVPSGTGCGSAQIQVIEPPMPTFGSPFPPSGPVRTSNTVSFQVNQPCGSGGGGGGNQPPTIHSITANPTNPNVGQSVSFLIGVSDPDGDAIVSYQWDFGDGSTASGTPMSHSYASAGTFTVTLTVQDSQGNSANATQTVQVGSGGGNQPPNASFSVSTTSPAVGQSVQFTNNSSDPDGDPLSFQWDFGDGNSSTNTSPSHTYNSAGSYTVSLTVSDNAGNSATATQTINVQSSSGGDGGSGQSGLAQYDANPQNCRIDQGEFLQMINDWIDKKIGQSLFFDGMNAWINQTDICAGSSGISRAPLAAVHVQSRPTASGVQFTAHGADVQSIHVRIFGLNGQPIAQRRADQAALAWNLTADDGQRVPNGVYLYRVTVEGADGHTVTRRVGKLGVVR